MAFETIAGDSPFQCIINKYFLLLQFLLFHGANLCRESEEIDKAFGVVVIIEVTGGKGCYDTRKKELVVWGQGEMAEIEHTDEDTISPGWIFYDEARKVRIKEGITKISDFAFCEFRSMTSLELPDTLRKLGYASFRDTPKLKKVHLPASLEVMGEGAFECSGLREVRIPGGVKKISQDAFFSVNI